MRFSRRLYYIVSGILLILPINFAVAAPMLAQQKPESHVDVVHMPEDAMTMLGKRAGEFDKLFQDIFGDTESESFAIPEESATLPSSSSQPSGPADESMTVEKPQPSIEEPPQVSSPDRAPQSGLKKMWLKKWQKSIVHPEGHSFINPDESSVTPPSPSPQFSGPDDGSMAIKDPLPSVSKETSQVSSSGRAPTDDGLIGYPENFSSPKRVKLSATRPSSGLQPSGVDGSMAIEKPLPSVSKEPSIVSSSDRALLSADDWMKKWRDIINHHKSLSSINLEKLKATRPSSISQPPGPATNSKKKKKIPVLSSELSMDDYMKKWRDVIKSISPTNLPEFPATRVSSISQPPGPADGSTAVGKSLPSISKEPLPVSSPDYTHSAQLKSNLVGQSESRFLEKPADSSPSGLLWSSPSQMDVQPSSSMSSTNSDSQQMGAGSSSGKWKRP